jgi:hypothetical protein
MAFLLVSLGTLIIGRLAALGTVLAAAPACLLFLL